MQKRRDAERWKKEKLGLRRQWRLLPHLNVGGDPGRHLLHRQQLGSTSPQHVRLDACDPDLARFQLLHLQTHKQAPV